ncbi:MAG: hypothetical protein KGL98_07325 [Gammaproteobacteria bacterium]|nr:hypothetical protein [Gammaproteobacteria bacterium]MDE1983936.1 hypothetical protein [Gammaproteobacteria bacterium]MDE2461045.1 hypothetical protein [Gammaproteobacteria bacterium]
MSISLGTYEFYKLNAVVHGICLGVLIILFVFLVKLEPFFKFTILGGSLFAGLSVNFILAFAWFGKVERILLDGDVKLWTVKRMAPLLFMSVVCALVGIVMMTIYPKTDIAIAMIVIFTGFLGIDLGHLAKINVRYKRKEKA